jgi:hypothetical protein
MLLRLPLNVSLLFSENEVVRADGWFQTIGGSTVLSRLQAFLPQMQAANEALPAQGSAEREQMDIENIEGDDRVVEMVSLSSWWRC